MATSARTLPTINTQDVRLASGSGSQSRDSVPYTATEAYAAASAAYYERPHENYTSGAYPYDSQLQAHDPYVHHRGALERDVRAPPALQPVEEQSQGAYEGLAYDDPDSHPTRRHPSAQHSRMASHSSATAQSHPAAPPTLVYDPDYVIAMHDFNPQPGNTTCLKFQAGEVIHVLNRDPTGWWDGELDGRRGWFPSNYISTDATAFAAAAELSGLTMVTVPDGAQESHAQVPRDHALSGSGSGASSSRQRSTGKKKARSKRHNRPASPSGTDPSEMSESVLDRRASCPPIMIPMVHALALLQNAVKMNRVTHFQPSTACIISCVRSVLSTCDCLNKDSANLENNPRLAQQRKRVLSELAALVGQARTASEKGQAAQAAADAEGEGKKAPLSPERLRELQDMVRRGDEVYGHVKKFLAIALECGIELPPDRLFAGAPGMDDAYAAPSMGHSTSGSRSSQSAPMHAGSSTGSSATQSSRSSQDESRHFRKPSSTSALYSRDLPASVDPSARDERDKDQDGDDAESPTLSQSSASDAASSGERDSWSGRARESSASTYRPRSLHDPKGKGPVFPSQIETYSPESAAMAQKRLSSNRGVGAQQPLLYRSPVRDASAPYRKPKYSISSVSSLSSYDSSLTGSESLGSDSDSYFPSGVCTSSQALGTLRITHDRLLSVIAAFIGHIHSHSRFSHASSKGHLIEMTRKTVDQVRYLLTLVDALEAHQDICEAKPREMAILRQARLALYAATNEIVEAVKDMLADEPITSEDDEKNRALQAATGTLRAGGECVKAVNMCLSTRMGDEEFVINIAFVQSSETPTHTSPPSVASSRTSSSPPSTPKSVAFRLGHHHSMSQPHVPPIRHKTHAASASVSEGIPSRRRADSDASPVRGSSAFRRPSEAVAEDLPEEVDEEPTEEGEETVRFPKDRLSVEAPEDSEAEDDSTPIPPSQPENDVTPSPAIPLLVVSDSLNPLAELPSSRSSQSTDLSKLSTSASPEESSPRTSLDAPEVKPRTSTSSDRDSVSLAPAHLEEVEDARDSSGVPARSGSGEEDSGEPEETQAATAAFEEKLIHGDLPATPSAPPEFVDAMYDPRDLLVNDSQQLIAASLEVMIIKIAPLSSTPDRSFVTAFLLTFRLFTTPSKFVDALINRWNVQPSPNWPTSERQEFEMKLPFMRIRVARCIKMWIDHYWVTETDDEVLPQLQELVDQPLPPGTDVSLTNVVGLIKTAVYAEIMRIRRGGTRPMDRTRTGAQLLPGREGTTSTTPTGEMPAPIVKRTVNSRLSELDTPVTELEALEVARQLTLMEAKLYSEVPAQELIELGKAGAKATHVKAISSFSTAVTGWVSESILGETDQKKRAGLLKYFIKVADRCIGLHNYSTMRSILAALDSSTITRLTKTWSHLSAKYKAQLDVMRRLTDHAKNYGVYRETLRATAPPAVPFLGLYLTDLTFCREGNPSSRPSPLDENRRLINFIKYYRLARIVQDVQRFQTMPYNLQAVPEIQKYLSNVIEKSKNTGDLQDLYRRSLVLEPRQASDTAPPDSKSGLLGWASRN
ncbi:hypothetical protein FRC04_003245 [Tulasnella sp. 424]|nr:hypothetical protein FRC04_003245 [Tulasnella sp. 424]KAG8965949.1 hypothetical protein FRC05_002940 [Tulasnella sp. 425]